MCALLHRVFLLPFTQTRSHTHTHIHNDDDQKYSWPVQFDIYKSNGKIRSLLCSRRTAAPYNTSTVLNLFRLFALVKYIFLEILYNFAPVSTFYLHFIYAIM